MDIHGSYGCPWNSQISLATWASICTVARKYTKALQNRPPMKHSVKALFWKQSQNIIVQLRNTVLAPLTLLRIHRSCSETCKCCAGSTGTPQVQNSTCGHQNNACGPQNNACGLQNNACGFKTTPVGSKIFTGSLKWKRLSPKNVNGQQWKFTHNTCVLQNSACGLQNCACSIQKQRLWAPEQCLWAPKQRLWAPEPRLWGREQRL